jgi:hypothetical protein
MTELAVDRGVWRVPRLSADEGATRCSVSLENPASSHAVVPMFSGLHLLYCMRLATFVVMIDYLRPTGSLGAGGAAARLFLSRLSTLPLN